jgi:hypothetical protein
MTNRYSRERTGVDSDDPDVFWLLSPGFNITEDWRCADCGHDPNSGIYHEKFDCPSCTESVCEDNYGACPQCGACLCSDECRYPADDEPDARDRGILNYSYKPYPEWFGGEGAPYYLGAELEISADSDASAQPIYEWARDAGYADLFYCKEDGSVDGFEIVTHPMTPEFVTAFHWDQFFEMINSEYPLGRWNTEEQHQHGLHIHVSRTAFKNSVSALARFSYLLNTNVDEMTAIARRGENHYTTFAQRPVSEVAMSNRDWCDRAQGLRWADDDARAKARYSAYGRRSLTGMAVTNAVRGDAYLERYRVVNLTNVATVEVRAFRSTRKASEFMDAMRLMIDAISFATTMQLSHMSTAARVAWPTFDAFRNGDATYQTALTV